MTSKYTKEDAYKNLDNINNWIANSATKASIILGTIGVLISIIFSNNTELLKILFGKMKKILENLNFCNILYLFLIFISISIIFFGTYCIFRVLCPTLHINEDDESKSILYFATISKYNNSTDFMIATHSVNEEEILNDILKQIYINSRICTIKFNILKKGLNICQLVSAYLLH